MATIPIPPGLQFEPISHTYWYDGTVVPSVTHVIRPIERYYRMSETQLRPYAQRGTEVHSWTERWDREFDLEPEEVPEDCRGYVTAWINFRHDFDFAPTHIEHRVFHPALHYAGTIDRLGTVRGKFSVVDIKTSSKLGPAVGVQLAAYARAWNSQESGREEIESRFAVQLMGDATYRVVEYDNPLDWEAFRGCLALHRWQEDHRFVLGDVRPRVHPNGDGETAWPQFVRNGKKGI